MDLEVIPELSPYYVGPWEDSDEEFFDALEEPPPPDYTPPPPPEDEVLEDGSSAFRCYKCGHFLGNCGTEYCLNCGMMIEKSTNTNYKECSRCNSYYLVESDCFFCNRCGSDLIPLSGEIYCLCGYMNAAGEESCVNCGYPLVYKRYKEVFKGHFHFNDGSTRYCYKCGLYLVPDSDETPNVYSPSPENCVICLVNKREVAFIPCGHRCICTDCSLEYHSKICPLCRFPYKDICKIYL